LVLCRSMWVSDCLWFFLVPSWSSNTPLYPQSVASQETCPQLFILPLFSPQAHIWIYQGVWERVTWRHGCFWDDVSPILAITKLWCIFCEHLDVFKTTFYYGKTHKVNEQEVKVHLLLNANDIDCRQGKFKFTMKSNATFFMVPPFDINPLIHMWCLVKTIWILVSSFLEYVKLVELIMVQILSSVEDERCFSTMVFMKLKLHNRFTTHLLIIVRMFAQ